ncbi:MAG: YceI family protein [Gammaproteobacteria bacterium]|nr:YceI family protein [Gammaproteobacteria bacterium]MDH5731915.1 YceI family protein [Gammaproteobacteria bacterium]
MLGKVLFVLGIIAALPLQAAEYYKIDSSHTYPHFSVAHMQFSTLYGRFDQTTGRIIIDWNNKNGFVDVKIAAVSITTGHQKRDDHLRSPDFLNVMEYPDITYQSKNINFVGKDKAVIEGELTLLGVSKPVSLQVNHLFCGPNPRSKKKTCGFEATGEINRSDFGSTYGAPGIGDKLKLWFQVEAIQED